MKITAYQLKKIIAEETRRILVENDDQIKQQQKEYYEALLQAERALVTIASIVDRKSQVKSTKFSEVGGDEEVDLQKVIKVISTNRDVEGDAPNYGGGLFKLPLPRK